MSWAAHTGIAVFTATFAIAACASTAADVDQVQEASQDSLHDGSGTAVADEHPATSAPRSPITLAPRVLLIGDSTLMAVDRYDGYRALRGFDYVFDAESCRTLGIPSCGDPPLPPNAVEAIESASGSFDNVVVMAGYDEWWTSFPSSFDEVVAAARAKGAQHIIWLTYPENVDYELPDGTRADEAFVRNNETLREKTSSGRYPDVVLAPWYPHPSVRDDWITRDGIHLTLAGALGVADYISRWVAHLEGLPCPAPTTVGGSIEAVCSHPGEQLPIDVKSLYA